MLGNATAFGFSAIPGENQGWDRDGCTSVKGLNLGENFVLMRLSVSASIVPTSSSLPAPKREGAIAARPQCRVLVPVAHVYHSCNSANVNGNDIVLADPCGRGSGVESAHGIAVVLLLAL
jgi:hypothetical protein